MKNSLLFFNRLNHWLILVGIIFLLHIFLRFYLLEQFTVFGWDQVDNAWTAKNIIVNHTFPLLGPAAKLNSGFYIGPAYYYFVAIVYWFFHLDPIASGVISGVTSIITFLTLFFVGKKIFSLPVAIFALYIHTVSFTAILFDRIQWNVNFIEATSLLIFYFLYKILLGEVKYIFPLFIITGFSFHVHFTAIFYALFILLSLPFFPKKILTLVYILISLPVFFIWFIPTGIEELQNKNSQVRNFFMYAQAYNHGFHFTRMKQLLNDAFIEFEEILTIKVLKPIEFFIIPIFAYVYLVTIQNKKRFLVVCYLIILWVLVPWIVFTLYNGEISDYYFSVNRPIGMLIISYLLFRMYTLKHIFFKLAVFILLALYALVNISLLTKLNFNQPGYLGYHRKNVIEKIKNNKTISFQEGSAESYLYFIYTRQQKK